MPNNIFEDMIESHRPVLPGDYVGAIRAAMQMIALAGLSRDGFFSQAAFYGGTCLKIFYGLDRDSEDLDFSILSQTSGFSLEKYFEPLHSEFAMAGREVKITQKKKTVETSVETAFLEDATGFYDSNGYRLPRIRIKIEVDTDPPPLFETENKVAMNPYSFMTRCYTLPSSYAGKMSAILYRGWQNRVKGRDWYDFEWYVRKGAEMDLAHFNSRAIKFGKVAKDVTQDSFKSLLREKIESVDIDLIKKDVLPFVSDPSKLDIWSREYFLQIMDLMKIIDRERQLE